MKTATQYTKLCFRLLAIVAVMFMPALLLAQDVIYRTDGGKIEAKVLEVGINEIKYRIFSNPDGPVYTVSKSKVVLITYQNGTHDVIGSMDAKQRRKQERHDTLASNRNKNLVALNLFDMGFSTITVSYERIFSKGYVGVRVPLSVGLRSLTDPHHYDYRFMQGRVWSAGADVNFYPTGQGRVRYFCGPSVLVGQFRYIPWYVLPVTRDHMHYAFTVNNGMLVQATENFNLSFTAGLGVKKDDVIFHRTGIDPKLTGTFNMAYRF
jgi:hypothetical protein